MKGAGWNEVLVYSPVGVVGNVVVALAARVTLGGAVESSPPAHCFRGLDQRGYKM